MGVSKTQGPCLEAPIVRGKPHNKDQNMLRFVLGPLIFGNSHMGSAMGGY